jgi:hypothetical protein
MEQSSPFPYPPNVRPTISMSTTHLKDVTISVVPSPYPPNQLKDVTISIIPSISPVSAVTATVVGEASLLLRYLLLHFLDFLNQFGLFILKGRDRLLVGILRGPERMQIILFATFSNLHSKPAISRLVALLLRVWNLELLDNGNLDLEIVEYIR